MRPDEDVVRIGHMLQCATTIQSYTKGKRRQLRKDPMLQDAVMRRFEVMGEAAGQVSQALRASHPDVPWKRIIAFRNVLIHAYDRIEIEPILDAIDALPGITASLRQILGRSPA